MEKLKEDAARDRERFLAKLMDDKKETTRSPVVYQNRMPMVDLDPHIVPAVNVAQLGINEVGRAIHYASRLQDGQKVAFSINTTFTDPTDGTIDTSFSVSLDPDDTMVAYRRRRIR